MPDCCDFLYRLRSVRLVGIVFIERRLILRPQVTQQQQQSLRTHSFNYRVSRSAQSTTHYLQLQTARPQRHMDYDFAALDAMLHPKQRLPLTPLNPRASWLLQMLRKLATQATRARKKVSTGTAPIFVLPIVDDLEVQNCADPPNAPSTSSSSSSCVTAPRRHRILLQRDDWILLGTGGMS